MFFIFAALATCEKLKDFFIFDGSLHFCRHRGRRVAILGALGRPHPFVTCPFVALAVCPLKKFPENSKDRLEQVKKAKREMMERGERGMERAPDHAEQRVSTRQGSRCRVAKANDDLRTIQKKTKDRGSKKGPERY